MFFNMKPERFLSMIILSALLVVIGLISQLQISAASSLEGDAFTNQFPNVDKLTRQEIADLRRSYAQKTINELKKQREATGEMDPGLFVMDIKPDTEPVKETPNKIIDEDEGPLAEVDIGEEEELLSHCDAEDMDEVVIDLDDENTEHKPPASGPKSDKRIDSKQTSATDGKNIEQTQHKSPASDTSTNQDEKLVQKEPTSTDDHDKTRTSKKSATPDNSLKGEAITKQKSPQKPDNHAKKTHNEDKQADKQSPATGNDKGEDQHSNDGEQIKQKSSSGVVNDEDKKATPVRIPSPATDSTDKEPTGHKSTASNTKKDKKHKKSSSTPTTDKKDKESNQKKFSATDEHAKADPEKPFKEEL